MSAQTGVPLNPLHTKPKTFWEKPYGKITIGVIIGTILIFIGYFINKHILNPSYKQEQSPILITAPTESSKSTLPLAQDTPEKIMAEIEGVPPLQRDDIAKAYIGIPVDWEVYYFHGKADKEQYNLFFRSSLSFSHVSIICALPKANNDQLRRLKEKTKLRIQGNIKNIDVFGIRLENAKLIY